MKKRIKQNPRWKVRLSGLGLGLLWVLWVPAHALQSRVADPYYPVCSRVTGPDYPICSRAAGPTYPAYSRVTDSAYPVCNRVTDSTVMENQCASSRRSEKAVPSAPWVYWGCQDSTMTAEGLSNRLRTLWRLGVGGLCLPAPAVNAPFAVVGSSSAAVSSASSTSSALSASSTLLNSSASSRAGRHSFGAASESGRWALTHALREAARLGLSCGIRLPMGTPMPQVMWSDTLLTGDVSLRNYRLSLPPEAGADYRDIAVYAIPQSAATAYVHPDSCVQLPLYQGKLTARLSEGTWRILRMGYGHPKNGRVGEWGAVPFCSQKLGAGPAWDRFDDRVVRQQFAEWWKACLQQLEAPVVAQVLKRLYVDSLSVVNAQGTVVAGKADRLFSGARLSSQSTSGAKVEGLSASGKLSSDAIVTELSASGLQVAWSEAFPQAFEHRRGYDLLRYLPVLAGVPLETKTRSSQVWQDMAQTMVELEQEVFYPTLQACAQALQADLIVLNGEKLPAGSLPSYVGGDFILLPEATAAVGSKVCSNDSLSVSSGALSDSSASSSASSGGLSSLSESSSASLDTLSLSSESLSGGLEAVRGKEVAERLPLRIKEWTLQFPGLRRSVVRSSLGDWREDDDAAIRRFTGAAVYRALFLWHPTENPEDRIVLRLGRVAQVAQVRINGLVCGSTLWSEPYEVDVTDALSSGPNTIEVEVMALVRPLPLVEPSDSLDPAESVPEASDATVPMQFASKPSGEHLSVGCTTKSGGTTVLDPASAPAGWVGPCEFWRYLIKKTAKSLQNPK